MRVDHLEIIEDRVKITKGIRGAVRLKVFVEKLGQIRGGELMKLRWTRVTGDARKVLEKAKQKAVITTCTTRHSPRRERGGRAIHKQRTE